LNTAGRLGILCGNTKGLAWPNMGLWLVKIHVNNINNKGRRMECGVEIPEKGN